MSQALQDLQSIAALSPHPNPHLVGLAFRECHREWGQHNPPNQFLCSFSRIPSCCLLGKDLVPQEPSQVPDLPLRLANLPVLCSWS